jgi:hypothetical protein
MFIRASLLRPPASLGVAQHCSHGVHELDRRWCLERAAPPDKANRDAAEMRRPIALVKSWLRLAVRWLGKVGWIKERSDAAPVAG